MDSDLKVSLMSAIASFHRRSCYPEAMEFELETIADIVYDVVEEYRKLLPPIQWHELIQDVDAASGGKFQRDPNTYTGHQMPEINFNSLARIVDKYRTGKPI